MGVAGHEGFGQKVQAGAVDHYPGAAHRINEGPAGGVAQDIDVPALGAVHEGLPHVAMDHQLAPLHDLAQLVLGVAVDGDGHAVDARGQVVAGAAVGVDLDVIGVGPEAAAEETLTPVAVGEELPPAELEGLAEETGVTAVAFRGEPGGVQHQHRVVPGRGRQALPGLKIDPAVAAGVGLAHSGGGLKNLRQGLHEQAQQVAAFLVAGIVAPVQEQGEAVDGRGLGAVAARSLGRGHRQCFPETGIGPDGDVSFDPGEEFLAADVLQVGLDQPA